MFFLFVLCLFFVEKKKSFLWSLHSHSEMGVKRNLNLQNSHLKPKETGSKYICCLNNSLHYRWAHLKSNLSKTLIFCFLGIRESRLNLGVGLLSGFESLNKLCPSSSVQFSLVKGDEPKWSLFFQLFIMGNVQTYTKAERIKNSQWNITQLPLLSNARFIYILIHSPFLPLLPSPIFPY